MPSLLMPLMAHDGWPIESSAIELHGLPIVYIPRHLDRISVFFLSRQLQLLRLLLFFQLQLILVLPTVTASPPLQCLLIRYLDCSPSDHTISFILAISVDQSLPLHSPHHVSDPYPHSDLVVREDRQVLRHMRLRILHVTTSSRASPS